MVERKGEREPEGQLVAWAVGEARRLRLLGLRVPRVLLDAGAAITADLVAVQEAAEKPPVGD